MTGEAVFEGLFAIAVGLYCIKQWRELGRFTFEAAGRVLAVEFYERAYLGVGIASVIVGLLRLLGVPFGMGGPG